MSGEQREVALSTPAYTIYRMLIEAAAKGEENLQNAVCGPLWVAGDSKFGLFPVPEAERIADPELSADVARFYPDDFIEGLSNAMATIAPADPLGCFMESSYPLMAHNSADGFLIRQWALEECLKWWADHGYHELVDNSLNQLVAMQYIRPFDRDLLEILTLWFARNGDSQRSLSLLEGAVIGCDKPEELTIRVEALLAA